MKRNVKVKICAPVHFVLLSLFFFYRTVISDCFAQQTTIQIDDIFNTDSTYYLNDFCNLEHIIKFEKNKDLIASNISRVEILDEHIAILNTLKKKIGVYTKNGILVTTISGNANSMFSSPNDMYYDAETKVLYVLDNKLNCLFGFNYKGDCLSTKNLDFIAARYVRCGAKEFFYSGRGLQDKGKTRNMGKIAFKNIEDEYFTYMCPNSTRIGISHRFNNYLAGFVESDLGQLYFNEMYSNQIYKFDDVTFKPLITLASSKFISESMMDRLYCPSDRTARLEIAKGKYMAILELKFSLNNIFFCVAKQPFGNELFFYNSTSRKLYNLKSFDSNLDSPVIFVPSNKTLICAKISAKTLRSRKDRIKKDSPLWQYLNDVEPNDLPLLLIYQLKAN